MSDWKEYKLGELATFYNGRAYKNGEFKTSGTPIVRIQNLTGEGKTVYSDLQLDENKYIENGDLIYAWSATFGPYIWRGEKSIYHYHIWKIVCNEKIIDKFYFYYKLKLISDSLKDNGNGSIFIHITKSFMENFKIKIPSLEKQKYISNILSNLDKKIRFNTQINQTLEQIAQALFKSWFVDFDPVRAKVQALSEGMSLEQAELAAMQAISGKTPEELTALSQTQPDCYAELAETAKAFPCEMVEVDGVEVPKGWEYKPADELFDIGIGKTPLRKETEWFSTNPDDMQWISIKDMGNSGVFITESSEFLTNQAVDKFNIRKIPENTVLLSFKLTIGRVSITTCETTTNEAIAHFKITDKSFLTTEYLYLFFQQFDFNSLGSTSSIATAVNSKTIKGIEILIPNEELIKAFQMKISNIFAQIKNLTIENKNLVETRDLLLPRLLNGELNG
ncbi:MULTISPECIES: restriction endonuclease subunit S [Haemophilus]|uniref:Type-1 restriction enzyme HindVIIP specificity protein n=4 Tax=Haemophilus TaxID=724 RepID=A0AAV2U5V6_HAEIF|nr:MULTISPECIES: restriction endonuclease subunit S [Haemophilus]EGF16406.1 type I restriction/modification specificity protein [Haemophilus aegyptius ATCC 11116]OBX85174.1 restriction endonuclease subunit S [Haemophilus aegyptius]QEQ59399.1 restriction endonuclease subunit S [Haemophilus influenzae biotype aegyptius]TMQ41945.1 restriction endonuclease subunit S [Haemophilus influenzae biotype aegyptius]UAK82115.1 restriction endonuclease subunit S [Haemophilus aegyptius]